MNPSFEQIITKVSTRMGHLDSFYARHWFVPTDGTPDIYRDLNSCNDIFRKSHEVELDTCIEVYSGNYCIALILINEYGYNEHITGKLKKPLIKNHLYKAGFYIKSYTGKYHGNGLGVKFSQDSIVFNSSEIHDFKLSPFYYNLYKTNKVFSDFEINNVDTSWTKYEYYFRALGNEKFITIGKFSEINDNNLIQIMSKNSKSNVNEIQHLLKANKIPYFIPNKKTIFLDFNYISGDYYFIDSVFVEELNAKEEIIASRKCENCIDNDPHTIDIPSQISYYVDKGYLGDLSLYINTTIKPNEIMQINLDKNKKILLVNNSTSLKIFEHSFKYPAKKVRNKTIQYSIVPKESSLSEKYKYHHLLQSDQDISIYSNFKNIKQ